MSSEPVENRKKLTSTKLFVKNNLRVFFSSLFCLKMKIIVILQIYICSCCFGLNIKKEKEEVFPVYAEPVYDAPRESRKFQEEFNYANHIKNLEKNNGNEVNFPKNDTFEIIVGNKYTVENNRNLNFATGRADTGFQVTYENETLLTDKLIVREYNKCAQTNSFSDCVKFKTLKFLQDLAVPIPAENLR